MTISIILSVLCFLFVTHHKCDSSLESRIREIAFFKQRALKLKLCFSSLYYRCELVTRPLTGKLSKELHLFSDLVVLVEGASLDLDSSSDSDTGVEMDKDRPQVKQDPYFDDMITRINVQLEEAVARGTSPYAIYGLEDDDADDWC